MNNIKLALQLIEAAISFEDYKKKYPGTKKTKADPMFSDKKKAPGKAKPVDKKYQDLLKKKQDGHPDFKDKSDLQLADQAGLKTTMPGGKWDKAKKDLKVKTQPQVEKETQKKVKDIYDANAPKKEKSKSNVHSLAEAKVKKNKEEFDALPHNVKGHVHHALGMLRDWGYPEYADKVQKGKVSLKDAGDWAEHNNFHQLAAVFRNEPDTDHSLIMHAQGVKNELDDRKRKPAYGWQERDDALDAAYEATNPEKRIFGDKAHEHLDDRDVTRKLNSLRYMQHHNLHNSDTHKRLTDEAKQHHDRFHKTYHDHKNHMEKEIKEQEEKVKNWKPDPKHPDWKKEDEQRWLDGNKATLEKHKAVGKHLGYEK